MKKIAVSLLLFAILLAGVAQARVDVQAKAVKKDGYIRMFFYSKSPLKVTPSLQNNTLKLSFDKDADVGLGNIEAVLGDNISGASVTSGGSVILLKLNNSNYSYRKFLGDNFIGVDLIKKAGNAPAVKEAKAVDKPVKAAKVEPPAVATVKPAPVPIVKPVIDHGVAEIKLFEQYDKAAISGVEAAPIAPEANPAPKVAASDEKKSPTKAQEDAVSPAIKDEADDNADEADNKEADNKDAAAPADKKDAATATASAAPEVDDTPKKNSPETFTPPSENDEEVVDKDAVAKASLNNKKKNVKAKIVFPWDEKVGAAVFVRGKYLWVIFDKFKMFDVAKITNENKDLFSNGQQIENKSYTILHIKLADKANFVAFKEDNNWVVGSAEEKSPPDIEPRMKTNVTELKGSKITVYSDDAMKPLRLLDPAVGDEMVVLPYTTENTGFIVPRVYTDFTFMPTAQGGAIKVVSDDVNVDVVAKGVAIAGPTNKLAGSAQSSLRQMQEREREAKLRSEKLKQSGVDITLVKFNTWLMGGEKSFKKDLEDLQWKITEVNWNEKSEPRLNLARFYFAHGLYTEALGVIKIIKEADAIYGATNDVKVVEGAALYMFGKYQDSVDIFNTVDMQSIDDKGQQEINFWKAAAILKIEEQIKVDKFMSIDESSAEKKPEGESVDEAENTKLMLDTSTKLLKIIRKMDPEFVNSDEIQKLESTARFVTSHYQEAIKRFEESDFYKQGTDSFSADDDKLWWSTSDRKKNDKADLPFMKSVDVFLKYYPNNIFNDFALLALESRLKKNDLVSAEEILGAFKEETRPQHKNSIEFLRGLFYAKDEEDAKAIATWTPITEDVFDRYNRTRAKFAMTTFQINKKQITEQEAIDRLNSLRLLWRGGILEFQVLNTLGEYYMQQKQYMEGFKVWRSAISAFPGSDESLLIAKKMSEKFVQVFSQGGVDEMPKLDALMLYYEFRELTPIGKLGDDMISRLSDRLIEVDLLDRAAALLTHQVRFRLVGEEKDQAALKLVRVHLMNHKPQDAYDVLNATYRDNINPDIMQERRYLESTALIELGQSNKVLALLKGDNSHRASFIRADVYWRNKVWKKVVEELETPFRDIRREEKALTNDEADQLLRLAVAYALTDNKTKLQILYEDFIDYVKDDARKKVFMFVSTDKGPVDYKNLEATVEFGDMQEFLQKFIESSADKVAAAGDAGAAAAAGAGQ